MPVRIKIHIYMVIVLSKFRIILFELFQRKNRDINLNIAVYSLKLVRLLRVALWAVIYNF